MLAEVSSRGEGDDEVAIDGAYAFAPEEVSGDLAVYELGSALGLGHGRAREVGRVPVGESPSGIAVNVRARLVERI